MKQPNYKRTNCNFVFRKKQLYFLFCDFWNLDFCILIFIAVRESLGPVIPENLIRSRFLP